MRRGTVLLFAVATAVALCLAPAAGATGSRGSHARVLVVDDDGHRRSCYGTRHPFRTIQAAVDRARPGDTIRVCPGRYEETVTVETAHPTIEGADAGRDATGHDRRRESLLGGRGCRQLRRRAGLLPAGAWGAGGGGRPA